MIRYIFAMERERDLFLEYAGEYPEGEIQICGINCKENFYSGTDDTIVNIGFAGGYKVGVGTLIEPNFAVYVPNMERVRIDSIFPLEHKICFTVDEFSTEPAVDYPSMYDMELFYLASAPHKKIYSIKIISDNLNEENCENYNEGEPWRKVGEYLRKYLG